MLCIVVALRLAVEKHEFHLTSLPKQASACSSAPCACILPIDTVLSRTVVVVIIQISLWLEPPKVKGHHKASSVTPHAKAFRLYIKALTPAVSQPCSSCSRTALSFEYLVVRVGFHFAGNAAKQDSRPFAFFASIS